MQFNVINAATGETILHNTCAAQFDRWYDAHADYRKPRSLTEVKPELRPDYLENEEAGHGDQWLVRD